MITADFTIDVGPPLILGFMVLFIVALLVLAWSLACMAALNDAPTISEREARSSTRPRGGVSSVEPIDGAEFPDFPGLTAWGDQLRERTEAGR